MLTKELEQNPGQQVIPDWALLKYANLPGWPDPELDPTGFLLMLEEAYEVQALNAESLVPTSKGGSK